MKLKIVSDGTPLNTKLVNAETGEAVEGVTSLRWEINSEDISIAEVKLEYIQAEVEGVVVPDVCKGTMDGQHQWAPSVEHDMELCVVCAETRYLR